MCTETFKILQNYLPADVAELLGSNESIVQQHQVLVLNVSCGDMVLKGVSEETLLSWYVHVRKPVV